MPDADVVESRSVCSVSLPCCAAAAAAGSVLMRAEAPAPRAVAVEMTAKRFAFLPEQVDVIEGDEVTLNVRSADGTHGIEIGKLKLKKAIPRGGDVVTLAFTAPAPGATPSPVPSIAVAGTTT